MRSTAISHIHAMYSRRHTLSLTHTHTHTHTLSLSLSLDLNLSPSLYLSLFLDVNHFPSLLTLSPTARQSIEGQAPHCQLLNTVAIDAHTDAGCSGHVDHAIRVHRPFGSDDITFPIA